MNEKENCVFILDVDGVMTDGGMWYTKDEKLLKMFGPDDHDTIKDLMKFMPVQFITGDRRGYPIVERRIKEEMRCDLEFVSHRPKERWEWIKNKFPDYATIFMGDGVYDYFSLQNCDYGITTSDALDHVKECANYITKHTGGNRAAAEACIHIMDYLKLDWKKGL